MSSNHDSQTPPAGELLVYQSQGMNAPLNVRLEGETVWLTQRQLSELYDVTVATINEHISNIYAEGEVLPEATIRKYLIVRLEGSRQVKRLIDHYNLEMILAIGFRVRSTRGTQFRRWANDRLSEYLVKGFTMDDERLKGVGGITDHFNELLERIRNIRASEARVYLELREIFSLAEDYRADDAETRLFFAVMQNKMHYAATGMTAAEIISTRADASQPHMGLKSWKGDRVLKADVGTAKNYLDEKEIDTLNRITVMFLDQAQFRAERRQHVYMNEWEGFLDKFLADLELPILEHRGTVTKAAAEKVAHTQYQAFTEQRRNLQLEEKDQNYVNELKDTARLLRDEAKKGKS